MCIRDRYDAIRMLRPRLTEVARRGGTITYKEAAAATGGAYLPQGLGPALDVLSEDCLRRDDRPWLPSPSRPGRPAVVGRRPRSGAARRQYAGARAGGGPSPSYRAHESPHAGPELRGQADTYVHPVRTSVASTPATASSSTARPCSDIAMANSGSHGDSAGLPERTRESGRCSATAR